MECIELHFRAEQPVHGESLLEGAQRAAHAVVDLASAEHVSQEAHFVGK